MPLYEYKCECGKEFEYIQSINADKLKKCPIDFECNSKRSVKRLISKSTFIINERGTMTDTKLRKELDID
jgi:putative FmdB family regulatory protein